MYDAVIGRFSSIDPARQYWSPFMAMGNDPVNQVDPTGGYSKFGAWWRNGFSMNGVYQSGGEWGFNTTSIDAGGDYVTTFNYGKNDINFQDVIDFSNGAANAISSNHAFGFGRMDIDNQSFKNGQFAGDVVSALMGIAEMYGGGTMALGGGIVTIGSGGTLAIAGVPAVGLGMAIAAEGAATTGTALGNIKRAIDEHGRVHSSGSYKKLNGNKAANDYAKSRGYKDAHDLKEAHVPGNGSKFDIEVNSTTGDGRLISKDGKVTVPIY